MNNISLIKLYVYWCINTNNKKSNIKTLQEFLNL